MKAREAYERLRRHMPPELLRVASADNPALDPDYPWEKS